MSKVTRGKEHAEFAEVLEGKAVRSLLSRACVMEYIQDYLDSCYFLSINPLSSLRHIFPQYEWRYHRLQNRKQALEVVAQSDFIWQGECFSVSDEDGWVFCTATARSPREPLKMFFGGTKKASQKVSSLVKAIESLKGNPVYFEVVNA